MEKSLPLRYPRLYTVANDGILLYDGGIEEAEFNKLDELNKLEDQYTPFPYDINYHVALSKHAGLGVFVVFLVTFLVVFCTIFILFSIYTMCRQKLTKQGSCCVSPPPSYSKCVKEDNKELPSYWQAVNATKANRVSIKCQQPSKGKHLPASYQVTRDNQLSYSCQSNTDNQLHTTHPITKNPRLPSSYQTTNYVQLPDIYQTTQKKPIICHTRQLSTAQLERRQFANPSIDSQHGKHVSIRDQQLSSSDTSCKNSKASNITNSCKNTILSGCTCVNISEDYNLAGLIEAQSLANKHLTSNLGTVRVSLPLPSYTTYKKDIAAQV